MKNKKKTETTHRNQTNLKQQMW